MMSDRFCINCKHCVIKGDIHYDCERPQNVSLVTGKIISSPCAVERIYNVSGDHCGVRGEFYEEKESLGDPDEYDGE